MAELLYIKKQEKSNLLLLGFSEEGESARYMVSEAVYSSVGRPLRGAVLTEEQMAEVVYADEEYRARKKALSLLVLADNNERNLRQKLLRYGIRREIADEVVSEMVGRGYVNEERQLERLVFSEAEDKLYGKRKILMRLAAKGYRAEDIKKVMRRLEEQGEIDFAKNKERLIERYLGEPSDPEEVKKLLYKHGY